jgi:prepilin-type N-terminal cleavage/methylation domain-containing protein
MRGGFTLIEIMVVIVIIMVLVSIVIYGAKHAQISGAVKRTQAELAVMEAALDHYKNDNGVYPPSTVTRDSGSGNAPGQIAINNSIQLYTAIGAGPKVYMTFKPIQLAKDPVSGRTYIIDPFGNSYNYYYQPQPAPLLVNQSGFDLWSCGPGGTNEPPNNIVANITNWKQ